MLSVHLKFLDSGLRVVRVDEFYSRNWGDKRSSVSFQWRHLFHGGWLGSRTLVGVEAHLIHSESPATCYEPWMNFKCADGRYQIRKCPMFTGGPPRP